MTRLNKFITPEELKRLQAEIACSGMFLSGGKPMGDPGFVVGQLVIKYGMPAGTALDPNNGEFVDPLDKPPVI